MKKIMAAAMLAVLFAAPAFAATRYHRPHIRHTMPKAHVAHVKTHKSHRGKK